MRQRGNRSVPRLDRLVRDFSFVTLHGVDLAALKSRSSELEAVFGCTKNRVPQASFDRRALNLVPCW
jgi:hypothetical protein